MKSKSTSRKRSVSTHKIVHLAAFLFVELLVACNRAGVPDAKLRGVFLRNRDDFNRLVLMSQQDRRVTRIDFDYTLMDTDAGPQRNVGLSEDRWQEYRVLFRKLGITGGIERPRAFPEAVLFYAGCDGSAIDADCKGFAYSEKPLLPVARSLDQPRLGDVFEPLDLNWYLFRWVT
jgi:hypothetical protein